MMKDKGQSLTEMAILFPLLIFIFVGLVEVGWAIRGYLTTVSLTREVDRFAARAEALDFDAVQPGWERVVAHYFDVSGTLTGWGLDLGGDSPNGTMWLSYYHIDTGYPCDPDTGCLRRCEDYSPIEWYYADDGILVPSLVPTYSISLGRPDPSPLDQAALIRQLIRENNRLNCFRWQLEPETFQPVVNDVIVTEILFRQDQLLGFPIMSNTFTDPLPLYAQTTMRRSQ